MDKTTLISVVAAMTSLGSLIIAIWATRLSKKTLDHAIAVQKRSEDKQYDQLRTELLISLADSRRLLDKARIEIGTLKACFDAESEPIKKTMNNYLNLFTEYLPNVESAINQIDMQWNKISILSNENSYRDLMDAKALFYRSLKDDELVYDSAIYAVAVFKEKMETAQKCFLGEAL